MSGLNNENKGESMDWGAAFGNNGDNGNNGRDVGLTDSEEDELLKEEGAQIGMLNDGGDDGVAGFRDVHVASEVTVTISDQNTPIVVFFGPPSCGKTMVLIRLARYLKSRGVYTMEPVRDFRPTWDKTYKEFCDNFNNMVGGSVAALSNSHVDFALISVCKTSGGAPVCQILEAPGEGYFDPQKPDHAFPGYVNTIIGSNNRKIWAVVLETFDENLSMSGKKGLYVNKIHRLKSDMDGKDKVVFVFNKIDQTRYVRSARSINYKSAMEYVGNRFPGIFEPFRNLNPLTRSLFGKKYNFDFVVFKTGSYEHDQLNNKKMFTQGPDFYPEILWEVILKRVRG